jgi:hypothetical protein
VAPVEREVEVMSLTVQPVRGELRVRPGRLYVAGDWTDAA